MLVYGVLYYDSPDPPLLCVYCTKGLGTYSILPTESVFLKQRVGGFRDFISGCFRKSVGEAIGHSTLISPM